jgi:hypothetical protein
MPKQRQDSMEWQALARTVFPNLDPTTASVIGDKLSKFDRTPLTAEENDIVKKVNQEANSQFQSERKAKLGKLKAETYREYQEGAYAARNKPGQSSFQDRYNNNFQSGLGQDAADNVSMQYYKLPGQNGQPDTILNQKQYAGLDRISKLEAQPLSPEENAQQRTLAAEKLARTNQQIQAQKIQGSQVQPSEVSEKAQTILENARQKGYTPEQTRIFLNANGIPIEEINKLVPQGGQVPESQFTPPTRPTPLVPATRPRQVVPIPEEDRKQMEVLMKALQKERNKKKR